MAVETELEMADEQALAERLVELVALHVVVGDPQFLDFVVDCLDRSGIMPGQVCFEVRESSVIANLSHAARFIAVLHGMGCQFALDDFGSGLGAFSNLKSLAMDYLKIDGNIIRGLADDHVNEAMVTAMVDLARTLDIGVVAEHVETEIAFDTVRRMGVDFQTNVVVGKTVSLDELMDEEGYDAVFVGTGAPTGRDLDLPGRSEAENNHEGVEVSRRGGDPGGHRFLAGG